MVGRQHLEVIAVSWKEPRLDFIGLIRANPKQQFTCVHDKTGEVVPVRKVASTDQKR